MDARAEQTRLWRDLGVKAVLFAVLVAGFAALAVYRFNAHAQQRVGAERDASDMRRKVVELKQQATFAQAFGQRFQTMADAGAIGSFNKPRELDRFETTLRPFNDQMERYALSGQAGFELQGAPALERYALYRHRLSFEMKPRHEEHFLRLMDAITRQTRGVAAIERCDIGRVSDDLAAGLIAHCTMNWYTFGDRAGPASGVTTPGGAPRPALSAQAK